MKSVNLSLADVVDLLRAEGSDVADIEAKSAAVGYPEDLASTLSAFGNMPGGGVIVLGLAERQGFKAVGVYDAVDAQRRLAAQARSAVEPSLQVTFVSDAIDGRPVIMARIRELPVANKPCEVTATGLAYLRSYDGDYTISQLERQAFIAGRGVSRFDRDAVEDASKGDLDVQLVTSYLVNCRSRSQRLTSMSDDNVLRHMKVLTSDGVPTVAGLYALGAYPQSFFPTLSITASVAPRKGDPPGTRARDIAHFDGPLPELLDQAMAWVSRNTRTRVRFGSDGHGRDEPQYPNEAVRELIANALVHRDLGPHALNSRVTITLEEDRLVVANPGGLFGITVEQLGKRSGGSPRNQALYEICKDVRTADGRRVIEGIGSGVLAITEALEDAAMTPPYFIDAAVRFTAIVPDHALLDVDAIAWLADLPGSEGLSETQRHVLALLRDGVVFTNRTLRSRFPMDSTRARALLLDLVDRELVEAVGDGRGRQYRLVQSASAQSDDIKRSAGNGHRHAEPGSKNGALVIDALGEGPISLAELSTATGLSERQARYALRRLRDGGLVIQDGGAGDRETVYRLA